MKERLGFVSNSSSSSFVLSASDPKEFNEEIEVSVKIKLSEMERGIVATKEELLDYFKEHFFHSSPEEINEDEDFLKYLEIISSGKVLFFGSAATDSDNPAEQLIARMSLSDLKLPKTLKIEYDSEGF